MKTLKRLLLLGSLAVLAACGSTDDPAPNSASNFTFEVIPTSANQPRGESIALLLTVARTGTFEGAVAFTLETPPQGISGGGSVAEGETEGELLIAVSEATALGEVTLTVKGQAETPALSAKKQTFTLNILESVTPIETPNPHDVIVTLDTARKTTAAIGAEGGTLSVAAADGTRFTLAVPANALLSKLELSMTPISAVDDLPLSGGLVGAVHLEPDGLMLLEPATLTITPAGVPTPNLVAFNSHDLGKEFYLQPFDSEDGSASLSLSHFSNPGVGTGALSDLITPLVPTDPADRFEHDAASNPNDILVHAGKFYLIVKRDLLIARSDSSRLRAAIQTFLTWRKEVSRAKLDNDFKAEIYEGWTLIAKGIENAVLEASDACVNDTDLSQLGEILGWVAWVKSNPRLAPYFEGKLTGFEAKAEACASFELEFTSALTVHTTSPSGEGYNITDITSDYLVTATVPIRYNLEEGILEGEGDLSFDSWETEGYFAYFGPPRSPDCPDVSPGTLEFYNPFTVGKDITQSSSLDTLLADLNTGESIASIDLVLFPGVALQLFKLSCDDGVSDAGGIENHGSWSVHLMQAYGYGKAMDWWRVSGFVFDGDTAEVTLPAYYSGPDLISADSGYMLELDGSTTFVLRHTPER